MKLRIVWIALYSTGAHYYIFKPNVGNGKTTRVTIHRRCRYWAQQLESSRWQGSSVPLNNPRRNAARWSAREVFSQDESNVVAIRRGILFTAWSKLRRRRCIYSSWINGASREPRHASALWYPPFRLPPSLLLCSPSLASA